jgi:hypothetical protein
VLRRQYPLTANVDPTPDEAMVGAGQHQQASGKQAVARVDTNRLRARHDTGLLGEQITTAARECPQLGHGLFNRAACSGQPDRRPRELGIQNPVGSGLRRREASLQCRTPVRIYATSSRDLRLPYAPVPLA